MNEAENALMRWGMVHVIGWGVVGLLLALVLWMRWQTRRWKLAHEAYEEFFAANEALERWRAHRPFLFVGQCPYAQSLVLRMIDAEYLLIRYQWGHVSAIDQLHALLNELPPPYDPRTPRKRGVFYFAGALLRCESAYWREPPTFLPGLKRLSGSKICFTSSNSRYTSSPYICRM